MIYSSAITTSTLTSLMSTMSTITNNSTITTRKLDSNKCRHFEDKAVKNLDFEKVFSF